MRELLAGVLPGVAVMLLVWLPTGILAGMERKSFARDNTMERYVLRQPKNVFGIGVVCAVMFFALFVAAAFFSGAWIGVFFLPFAFLGLFLVVYSSRWKIIVTGDELTFHRLLKKPITLTMRDIDQVQQHRNGLRIFYGGKKLCDVENYITGFDLLYDRLFELGKIDSPPKNLAAFTVHRSRNDILGNACGVLICAGVLGRAIYQFAGAILHGIPLPNLSYFQNARNTYWLERIAETALLLGLFLMLLYFLISATRFFIGVDGLAVTIRKGLGKPLTMPFDSIDLVVVNPNNTLLLMQGQTVLIKVAPNCRGFLSLVERLEIELVPFVQKRTP